MENLPSLRSPRRRPPQAGNTTREDHHAMPSRSRYDSSPLRYLLIGLAVLALIAAVWVWGGPQ